MYSLKPARARTGSSAYWCEQRAYTPMVKGRMSYIDVSSDSVESFGDVHTQARICRG